VAIPTTGPLPLELGIGRMAKTSEAAGAESLWVSDHLVMASGADGTYPYSADGRITWRLDEDYYEALTCCSLIAADTTRARIGTAVLILPQRNVIELSKTTATLDRLSGGRLTLGVGAGWNEPEMESLGYSFAGRGGRMDEMILALRSCWSGRPKAITGTHVRLPDGLRLFPTPVQRGGPPILVGGMSRPALRRAAILGDGWLGLTFAERFSSDELRERLQLLSQLRSEGGMEGPFRTAIKVHTKPPQADDIPALVHECRHLGFEDIIIQPPWEHGLDKTTAIIQAARTAASD
jgi:probable F420-dependent oxidoreductase